VGKLAIPNKERIMNFRFSFSNRRLALALAYLMGCAYVYTAVYVDGIVGIAARIAIVIGIFFSVVLCDREKPIIRGR
jgi:hypothetical protein